MAKKRVSRKRSSKRSTQPPQAQAFAHADAGDRPFPYAEKMKRKEYEARLHELQIELLKMQNWIKSRNEKVLIIFEGRDAAGKGGTIKRFTEHLNPRGARVVALPKPTDAERGQWYFQRYVAHLPTSGEIVFFDRSWYNRAGVEPVMGFCNPRQYARFIRQVSPLESAFVESGIWLFKLWFDVSRDEQRRRIESRKLDPLKHWKLSPMDDESMNRWDDYTKARDSMFLHTDTTSCPWTVIRSDDKKRARIGAFLHVLNTLPYDDKDESVISNPDDKIVGRVRDMFPLEGRFMFKEMEGG